MQKITKPDTTDMTGFVVVDLDDAPTADGLVRAAKKILVDGARTMARSRTYAWALLGEKVSGASAAINATPDQLEAGVGTFVDAVRDQVAEGKLSLDPGKGLSREDLAALDEVDRRNPILRSARDHGSLADELLATSAVAAASAALGGIEGRRVCIEGAGDALPALLATLDKAGASIVAVGTATGTVADPSGLDVSAVTDAHLQHGDGLAGALGSEARPDALLQTEADILMCGSKLGLVDHEVANDLPQQLLVPIGPVPVTAKGLAVGSRRGVVVLPDFLTTSGPLHAFRADASMTAEQLLDRANAHAATTTGELLDHPEGPLLGACYRAEEFLRTWQEELPFGRPLA